MTKTTKERRKASIAGRLPQGFIPHGGRGLVAVDLKPSKVKTTMREKALLFYQSCFISTRNVLRSLIGSI